MPLYVNPFVGVGMGLRNDLLEEEPTAGYGLFQSRQQGPLNLKNWLQGQYNRLYGQYAGESALDPTLRWFDYLAKLDLNKEYGGLPAFQRGERPGTFAPRSRYIGY